MPGIFDSLEKADLAGKNMGEFSQMMQGIQELHARKQIANQTVGALQDFISKTPVAQADQPFTQAMSGIMGAQASVPFPDANQITQEAMGVMNTLQAHQSNMALAKAATDNIGAQIQQMTTEGEQANPDMKRLYQMAGLGSLVASLQSLKAQSAAMQQTGQYDPQVYSMTDQLLNNFNRGVGTIMLRLQEEASLEERKRHDAVMETQGQQRIDKPPASKGLSPASKAATIQKIKQVTADNITLGQLAAKAGQSTLATVKVAGLNIPAGGTIPDAATLKALIDANNRALEGWNREIGGTWTAPQQGGASAPAGGSSDTTNTSGKFTVGQLYKDPSSGKLYKYRGGDPNDPKSFEEQ